MAKKLIDPDQANIAACGEWQVIDLRLLPEKLRRSALRLNALASSFYFGRVILDYPDLSPNLHYQMLKSIERDKLHEVREYPRGCFKTTCFSLIAPIWWALPFSAYDEDLMSNLGYGPEWIRWMKRAHDQNTSTLILTETEENVVKMGAEIDGHYKSNQFFRDLFNEILPDSSCVWNMSSMKQKRTKPSREGTYEFAGTTTALQSRHYVRIVEDDLFGEKALNSDTVAQKAMEFHRKVPGLFRPDRTRPGHIGDNIVVGNRWALNDLNGWIRKNQPWYNFESHAIDGGCCDLHPKGEFIFPEMFNEEKIRKLRETLGPTAYAAQYLNNPHDSSNRVFSDEWVQHYSIENMPHPHGLRETDGKMKWVSSLHHDTFDGKVEKDIFLSELDRYAVIDFAHNEALDGRSRHAFHIIGHTSRFSRPRFYALQSHAKRGGYSEFIDQLLKSAKAWRVNTIWCEVLAGQEGWAYYLNLLLKDVPSITVKPLKIDRTPNAKHRRIMSLEPLFCNHQLWFSRAAGGYGDFRSEYDVYRSNGSLDLLDTLGYAIQCVNLDSTDRQRTSEWLRQRENSITSQIGLGYSY